jgi:hypothetical protein
MIPEKEDVVGDARTQAKDLFGSPTRLYLLLWIRDRDKAFFQSEPPRSVGVPNQIRQELQRLERLGMIQASSNPDSSRIYYDKRPSPLWDIVVAAAPHFPMPSDTS